MRKKILLTLVMALSVMTLFAQLEKGKLYADLSVGQRITRYNAWRVSPGLSYALNEHVSVGAYFEYMRHQRYETLNGSGFANKYSAGISISYFDYLGKSNKWGWYINSNLQYSEHRSYTSEGGITGFEKEFKMTQLIVTPGVFYTPSKRILLFGNIGGTTISRDNNKNMAMSFDFGSQINLGMKLNLGRKKK